MLEVLVDNRNGNVWDISEIVTNEKWKTSRIGKPAEFDFTLLKGGVNDDKKFHIANGNVIRVRKKQEGKWENVFYGYVFTIKDGKDEDVQIKAYDQTRYLMFNDTYVFKKAKANEIVKKIAKDFNLSTSTLTDTGYVIPTMVEDNKKLMDIICKALDLTLINSNRNYVFYDDFGKLTIRNVKDMLVLISIGDNSLLYDFSYEKSIDSETYNRIKIIKDNKKSGKRDVYILQDSKNIAKWGLLQLYQKVDEDKNEAQIKELGNQLMKLKNREEKSFKLEAIGDIRVRAGCYVPITISSLGIDQPFLVNEATHSFDGNDHTMSIELQMV